MTTVQGTAEYMTPEQLNTEQGVGPKVDIWAFGATLVHMLSGSPPFAGSSMAQICMKVAMQRQQPELPWQAHSSPALAKLLQGCFAYEPTAVEALQLLGEAMAAAGLAADGSEEPAWQWTPAASQQPSQIRQQPQTAVVVGLQRVALLQGGRPAAAQMACQRRWRLALQSACLQPSQQSSKSSRSLLKPCSSSSSSSSSLLPSPWLYPWRRPHHCRSC
jgi:serine/threonine protein kinase